MRGKLFTFAALLSLLFFVGTVVLWVLGYNVAHAIGGTTPGSIYFLNVSRGRMGVAVASLKGGGFSVYHSSSPPGEIATYGRLAKLGFFIDTRTGATGQRRIAVVFPMAVPVIAAAQLPALWLVFRHRKTSPNGSCPVCHYNLTGNTSGVCPECGTAVAGKAVA